VLILVVIVAMAILFPKFDVVIGFLGSCLCFTICIILPLAFYLKTFKDAINLRERLLDWFLIIVCTILAVVGTVFAFLPRQKLGLV
jgi:solute carrier family 32 (vesicular inhibitory amino acid transporter)